MDSNWVERVAKQRPDVTWSATLNHNVASCGNDVLCWPWQLWLWFTCRGNGLSSSKTLFLCRPGDIYQQSYKCGYLFALMYTHMTCRYITHSANHVYLCPSIQLNLLVKWIFYLIHVSSTWNYKQIKQFKLQMCNMDLYYLVALLNLTKLYISKVAMTNAYTLSLSCICTYWCIVIP